ncbi:MAG: PAS domain S-box protein [Nitrospinae bacterium]|nr:PAS domain S-box protein [Nitrospinota bacterium]
MTVKKQKSSTLNRPGRYAVLSVALVGISSLALVIYSNMTWESLIAREISLVSRIQEVEFMLVEGHLWLDETSTGVRHPRQEKLRNVFEKTDDAIGDCLRVSSESSDPSISEKLVMARSVIRELARFTHANWADLVSEDGLEDIRNRFDSIYNVAMIQLKAARDRAETQKMNEIAHEKKVLYIIIATWVATVGTVLGTISFLALKRRQTEKQLSDNERRFRRLVENSKDIIYRYRLAEPRGFEYVSPALAMALGESPEEYYRNPDLWMEAVNADHKDVMENVMKLKEGIEEPVTLKFTRKDGRTVWMELSNSPVYGKRGDVVAVEGIARNVTSRKEDEEELIRAKEQAEEATILKDQFVSLVSHDLRAPLGAMLGMLKLLEPGEKEKEIVRRVIASGEGLLNMIDQLLNISRLKTGKIRPRKMFVDAHGLAESQMGALSFTAERKGVKMVNRIPKGIRLFADFTLLGEVAQNLLSNAIKFCRQGDTVTLFVPEDRPCSIAVKDTGAGIHPAILGDLFRHEVKTTTQGTDGEKGTGLGLPYCKDIMDAHGGTLEVESGPGKGTVFYIGLPKTRAVAIVVEADEEQRGALTSHIKEMGAEAMEADNVKAALVLMADRPPNLILAGATPEDPDGMTLLRKVKSDTSLDQVPVIVVTSSGDADLRQEAYDLGAVHVIQKPVTASEFAPRVRRFVS